MRKYDYKQLRTAAASSTATQDDINALGEWFAEYGEVYWNGEYYDVDDGIRLFPIYKASEENEDCFDIIGYEFK